MKSGRAYGEEDGVRGDEMEEGDDGHGVGAISRRTSLVLLRARAKVYRG